MWFANRIIEEQQWYKIKSAVMDWRSSWPKLLTWHIWTQVQLRLGLTMDLLDTRQAGQPGPSYTWPLIFFSVEIFAVRGSIRLNRFCVCNDGSFISFETKMCFKGRKLMGILNIHGEVGISLLQKVLWIKKKC